MDGSSKQPSSDVTAMDGSGSNKSSNSHRTNTNTGDTDPSASSPTPLTASAGADPEYCTSSSSTTVAMMTTSGDIRSNSFALPTPIPPLSPGCGCMVVDPPTADLDEITISITPTTGGQFELVVERNETIENLKKMISKRLKVAKERICLLHRERQLREGTLKENCLQDGSRLTLLPSVETGLMGQRPEQSVMQALENLNDSQVNDFLSGKAPLNLTMRLGDQMMLIQLQLSTVTPSSPHASSVGPSTGVAMSSNVASSPSSPSSSPASPTPSPPPSSSLPSLSPLSPSENIGSNNIGNTSTSATSTSMTSGVDSLPTSVHRRLSDHLGRSMRIAKQNGHTPGGTSSLISSLASALHAASCSTSLSTATTTTNPCGSERAVSPPIPSSSSSSSSSSSTSSSCSPPLSPSSSRVVWHRKQLLHYRHPHYHHHHHHHHHSRKEQTSCEFVQTSTSSLTSLTEPTNPTMTNQDSLSTTHCTPPKKKLCTMGHQSPIDMPRIPDSESGLQSPNNSIMSLSTSSKITASTLDTRALAEASRNLTQKLKQLSSEEHARRRQGAIIESMHHHGKGVYSGTFSGTLNPALQDRHGRPKRDISTIIHILNDLLCATPLQNNGASTSHYRHHHRHSGTRQPSSGTSSLGSTSALCGATSLNGNQDVPSTPEYSIEELSKENEATKGKMRRLRLVMEQRRAKRKARRQARAAPYTTQWAAVTPESNADDESTTPGKKSTEQQNESELQPCSPEPVVA